MAVEDEGGVARPLAIPAEVIRSGMVASCVLVILLLGCTSATAPTMSAASSDSVAVPGDPASAPQANCDADAALAFVGQVATPDVVDAAMQAAHAAEVRVIPKDGGATRDFKPDRLNVMLDANGRIAELRCG